MILVFIGYSCKRPYASSSTISSSQNPPPDMVFVEGKGNTPSFYVSITEETNINYVTYLKWLQEVYVDFPEVYQEARIKVNIPDNFKFFNDPSIRYQMDHPAFAHYPVVGATWNQANNYLQWKTDRLNESILVSLNLHEHNPDPVNEHNFNLEAYLYSQYRGYPKSKNTNENATEWTDGVFLPGYRLPTEQEWELLKDEASTGGKTSHYPNGKDYFINYWATKKPTTNYNFYEYEWQPPDYASYWKKENAQAIKSSGIQGARKMKSPTKPMYVAGNVREWLLDNFSDTVKTYSNPFDYLTAQGFEVYDPNVKGRSDGRIFDMDGLIDIKDDLGKLPFRILDINLDGSPTWVIPPETRSGYFIYYTDTMKQYIDLAKGAVKPTRDWLEFYQYNKIYIDYFFELHREESLADFWNSLERAKQYNKAQYQIPDNYENTTMKDSFRHEWFQGIWDKLEGDVIGVDLYSSKRIYSDSNGIFMKTLAGGRKKVTVDYSNQQRLIRGGTWQNPDFHHREGLQPDSSRADVGFRSVMIFAGKQVVKSLQVEWE